MDKELKQRKSLDDKCFQSVRITFDDGTYSLYSGLYTVQESEVGKIHITNIEFYRPTELPKNTAWDKMEVD